jgi:hypothetical protein
MICRATGIDYLQLQALPERVYAVLLDELPKG